MVAEVKIEQAKRVRKVSTGHIVFVGLRLATPAIQYGIFAFGWGNALLTLVGLDTEQPFVTGELTARQWLLVGFSAVAAVRHAVRALVFDAAEPDAAEPARNTLVEAAAEFAADSVNALLSLRVVDGTLGAVQLVATAAFALGSLVESLAGLQHLRFVESVHVDGAHVAAAAAAADGVAAADEKITTVGTPVVKDVAEQIEEHPVIDADGTRRIVRTIRTTTTTAVPTTTTTIHHAAPATDSTKPHSGTAHALPNHDSLLFTNGLFAHARHINYGGYLIWRSATGIATGNSAGIWLFLFVLPDLAFRRVPALETYLAKKYPLQWDDFVKRTPKKLIPYVY